MKVSLPKIITSEISGAATIDTLSFVLHQIDSKLINLGFTLSIKYSDSIMTDQLNQVTHHSKQNNALSDDDEPDLQQQKLKKLVYVG